MSTLHIAHVVLTGGRVEDIDCDAAHVNDAGYLALTINTYVGAIALYAPGEWSSYQLEFPPTPEQPGLPSAGCLLHFRRRGTYGCVVGCVVDVDGDLIVMETNGIQDPDYKQRMTRVHDETQVRDGSWHWPHDDCVAATQQAVTGDENLDDYRRYRDLIESAKQPQITINVTVEGSVLSERKLSDTIVRQLNRVAAQRGLRL